jgi:hypothetical protein
VGKGGIQDRNDEEEKKKWLICILLIPCSLSTPQYLSPAVYQREWVKRSLLSAGSCLALEPRLTSAKERRHWTFCSNDIINELILTGSCAQHESETTGGM